MHPSREYDAVIVGGGPAGLSAALVLGRARWRVLVIDHGRPANAVSHGVGGLLGQSGVDPAALRATGREQLARHPTVEVCNDEVAGIDRHGADFLVDLERRRRCAPTRWSSPMACATTRRRWRGSTSCGAARSSIALSATAGRSATFPSRCTAAARRRRARRSCWRTGAMTWSSAATARSPAIARRSRAPACASARSPSAGSRSAGHLERIEFEHGPSELRDALFVSTRRDQPNDLAGTLGCDLTDAGTIATDVDGRTSVSGVYAVGDAATAHSRSVANAIGTGSRAAYALALDRVPALAA